MDEFTAINIEVSAETYRELQEVRKVMNRILPNPPREFTPSEQLTIIVGVAVLKLFLAFEPYMDGKQAPADLGELLFRAGAMQGQKMGPAGTEA